MYKVLISRRAEKQILSLSKTTQQTILDKLKSLKHNPYSGDVKKLKGEKIRYRLRVGNYRIIYDIQKESVSVLVLTVRHRKDAYR